MLIPLYDKLIVRRDKAAEKIGNIFISDNAKEAPSTGTVLATGEGRLCPTLFGANGLCHVEPLRVKVGDRIIFQSYAGSEVSYNGEPVLLMQEDDVITVVPATPALAAA